MPVGIALFVVEIQCGSDAESDCQNPTKSLPLNSYIIFNGNCFKNFT